MSSIETIQYKLELLKSASNKLAVFGATTHGYRFANPLSQSSIHAFEVAYGIELPAGYRKFLQVMGNGGAGPYYGIVPIEASRYADLDYKHPGGYIDPSKPFQFTTAWNMDLHEADDETYLKLKEEHYFDNEWVNGMLRICNFGCGVSINIVVNGPAYGQVWVDDRCNDGGIYPDQHFGNKAPVDFLTWYDLWLEQSLALVGVSF